VPKKGLIPRNKGGTFPKSPNLLGFQTPVKEVKKIGGEPIKKELRNLPPNNGGKVLRGFNQN